MHRWWDGRPAERFWLEITDRTDLGVDLKAPQAGDNGREVWSYSLVNDVEDDDVVFHYWKPEAAITAWSRAVGESWEEEIEWASHGMVARDAGVLPYRRPGFRMGLQDFTDLDEPVTLDEIRLAEPALRTIVAALEDDVGKPVYFPVALSELRPPRMQQAYLTKLPAAMVDWFPSLTAAASRADIAALPRSADGTSVDVGLGVEYREADEEASTSERDAFAVDPSVVERGLRGHAATQNALAAWVMAQGLVPRSPKPEEPNFDLAWQDRGISFVAEVKSTTISNEEKQLRLGLGQVLRYRQLLARTGCEARAVLAVERKPSDETWITLCRELRVDLVWPGHFDSTERSSR
jgi:hypothetical protein